MTQLDDVDLNGCEMDDLKQFRQKLDKEIKLRELDQARVARKALRETAKSYGFNLNDLVKTESSARNRPRKPRVRFRHPDAPEKTWGGRGRKPAWVREWQEAGGTLDAIRVHDTDA